MRSRLVRLRVMQFNARTYRDWPWQQAASDSHLRDFKRHLKRLSLTAVKATSFSPSGWKNLFTWTFCLIYISFQNSPLFSRSFLFAASVQWLCCERTLPPVAFFIAHINSDGLSRGVVVISGWKYLPLVMDVVENWTPKMLTIPNSWVRWSRITVTVEFITLTQTRMHG